MPQPSSSSPPILKSTSPVNPVEVLMRVRVKGLEIPPIKDGLVIGRNAAVGAEAMQRTLSIMAHEEFELLNLSDEVIENVIVRTAIVRKVGRDRLVRFVVANLRPIM